VSVKEGGLQIEFEDQDPAIHQMYLCALAKSGVECRTAPFGASAAEKKVG
jgi:hypothetical protein